MTIERVRDIYLFVAQPPFGGIMTGWHRSEPRQRLKLLGGIPMRVIAESTSNQPVARDLLSARLDPIDDHRMHALCLRAVQGVTHQSCPGVTCMEALPDLLLLLMNGQFKIATSSIPHYRISHWTNSISAIRLSLHLALFVPPPYSSDTAMSAVIRPVARLISRPCVASSSRLPLSSLAITQSALLPLHRPSRSYSSPARRPATTLATASAALSDALPASLLPSSAQPSSAGPTTPLVVQPPSLEAIKAEGYLDDAELVPPDDAYLNITDPALQVSCLPEMSSKLRPSNSYESQRESRKMSSIKG